MSDRNRWVLCPISDADEPEDLVRAGMRHRDFDGVMLLLVPDGEPGDFGWYGTEMAQDERPTRPLLLFFRGESPLPEIAQAWAEECLQNGASEHAVSSPRNFSDYGALEETRTVAVHLNYPPYPWIEEAGLGMEMGKYFPCVETVDLIPPTESQQGVYSFRFFHSGAEPVDAAAVGPRFCADDPPF